MYEEPRTEHLCKKAQIKWKINSNNQRRSKCDDNDSGMAQGTLHHRTHIERLVRGTHNSNASIRITHAKAIGISMRRLIWSMWFVICKTMCARTYCTAPTESPSLNLTFNDEGKTEIYRKLRAHNFRNSIWFIVCNSTSTIESRVYTCKLSQSRLGVLSSTSAANGSTIADAHTSTLSKGELDVWVRWLMWWYMREIQWIYNQFTLMSVLLFY